VRVRSRLLAGLAMAWLTIASATAQFAVPMVPNSSGGGGGSGTVTSVSTTCPTSSNSPISGVVTLAGGIIPVTRSASTDTLASGDCSHEILYNYAGSVASALPSASSLGANWFVNISAATGTAVTVTSAGGNFSNTGGTTLTIPAGGAAAIVSDGTNFSVNASGAGGGVPHTGWISGDWYPLANTGSATGTAQATNSIYCAVLLAPSQGINIKSIGFQVLTALAGSYVSAALYTDVGGNPGSLIDYVAPLSMSATGAVSGALANGNDALSAGAYWACESANDNSGSPIILASNTGSPGPWNVGLTAITTNANLANGISCSSCGTGAGT
jgi:hypothetical protein